MDQEAIDALRQRIAGLIPKARAIRTDYIIANGKSRRVLAIEGPRKPVNLLLSPYEQIRRSAVHTAQSQFGLSEPQALALLDAGAALGEHNDVGAWLLQVDERPEHRLDDVRFGDEPTDAIPGLVACIDLLAELLPAIVHIDTERNTQPAHQGGTPKQTYWIRVFNADGLCADLGLSTVMPVIRAYAQAPEALSEQSGRRLTRWARQLDVQPASLRVAVPLVQDLVAIQGATSIRLR